VIVIVIVIVLFILYQVIMVLKRWQALTCIFERPARVNIIILQLGAILLFGKCQRVRDMQPQPRISACREEQRRGAQPSVGANSETPTEAVSRKQYTGSRLEDSFPLAAAQHWLEDAAVGAGEAGVKEFELHLRPLSRQGTPPSRHPTPFVPRSDPSSDFRRVESPAQNPELSAARPDSSVGIRRKEPPPRRPFDTSGSPRDPQEGSGTPRDVPGRKAGSDGEEVRGERPGRGDDAEVVKVLRRKRESIGGKGGIVADILDEGAVMDPYKAHPMDSAQDLDFQARGNAQQQVWAMHTHWVTPVILFLSGLDKPRFLSMQYTGL
jgi:hypothetical protein